MIAYDTGHAYVDETAFCGDAELWARELLELAKPCVMQAPGLTHCCHRMNADIVVMVLREVNDIVASQNKLGWLREPDELAKYGALRGPVAAVKYSVWETQKKFCDRWCEVHYSSLKKHPLWLPKEGRGGFNWKQTESEKENDGGKEA